MGKRHWFRGAVAAAFMGLCVSAGAQTPPVVPAWAFGHIVWEDNINTREGAESLVDGYLQRDIPVGGIIIDSPWCTAYNSFEWDEARYPGHKEMIDRFNAQGVRVILWLTGAVNRLSKDTPENEAPQYKFLAQSNYGINGSQPHEWWKGEGIHIDFTNPEAVKWWETQLDKVFWEGISGWKVDQGELWFGDILETSKGAMGNSDFKHYYYDAMYDYTVRNKPDAITIARPYSHQGGLHSSPDKASVGWCGDFSGDWAGLRQQIDNIYRSSLAGYGAVGCEIGGFMGRASNKEQLIRYAQFGCMTATMVNGGENGAFRNHLPWFHGDDAADIYRACVKLHVSLKPYLFSCQVDNHLRGGSLVNHVSFQEESHMLGDALFTKAITSDDHTVTFSLPEEGEWIDWWTGERHYAGQTLTMDCPLDRFPLFVKAGSVIPTDEGGRRRLTVWSCGVPVSKVLHLPSGDGIDFADVLLRYDPASGALTLDGANPSDFEIVIK